MFKCEICDEPGIFKEVKFMNRKARICKGCRNNLGYNDKKKEEKKANVKKNN